MRVACLFSGGKDSTYSTYIVKQNGWEIETLLTFTPATDESYMFHHPNIEWTRLQAQSMGLKQTFAKTSGEKEKELEDLQKAIGSLKNIDGIVSGALASDYQKSRIDNICKELGLQSIAPLWHTDLEAYLHEISHNFEVIFTSVSAEGFDESWLGRKLDSAAISDLKKLNVKYGVSLGGEGGEFETFVLNGPNFSRPIKIEKAEKEWKGMRGNYNIIGAKIL